MTVSRDRIITAATGLFTGGSFHFVGIAEICEVAGVNKGTFYHFFPSKIALLVEAIDIYTREILKSFAQITASNDTPAGKIRTIFTIPQSRNESWQDAHGMASGCFIGNSCMELAATEAVVREKVDWALRELAKGLEPIVAEHVKREGVSVVDSLATAEIIMGIMQGAQVMAKAKNDPSIFVTYGELAVRAMQATAITPALASKNGPSLGPPPR